MKNRGLRIAMEAGLHHGSGFGIAGIVDRAVLRDRRGVPYLAGSAIKGRLRHASLRVILAEDGNACYTGDATDWCEPSQPCHLCLLFGSPRQKGTLIFGDAYPADGRDVFWEQLNNLRSPGGLHPETELRSRTAINRVTRTARAEGLFVTEVLPDFLVFEGKIFGTLERETRSLLEKACRVVTSFGADSARGLGRCHLTLHPETI